MPRNLCFHCNQYGVPNHSLLWYPKFVTLYVGVALLLALRYFLPNDMTAAVFLTVATIVISAWLPFTARCKICGWTGEA